MERREKERRKEGMGERGNEGMLEGRTTSLTPGTFSERTKKIFPLEKT
jgi:hypothetical protein